MPKRPEDAAPAGPREGGTPEAPSAPAVHPELDFGVPAGPAAPEPPSPRAPRTPGDWVALIREQEMPALGATVALVHSVTEDERATTDRLAQVILQDAAMTTKVLKLANSVFYNPARQSISTISRAIVVLGFDVVAEIAIGIRLVDSLLSGGVRQRVVGEMARSFHAAVQARALAEMRREGQSEEVFIAALLGRVGEMAFWCFGGPVARRLESQLQTGRMSPEEAQMTVLGFRLRQISVGLAREWKLGPLLQSVLEGGRRLAPVEQCIALAQRFASQVESGWEATGTRELIAELSGFAGVPVDEMQERLAASAEEAARIAACYGADEAAGRIPLARHAAEGATAGRVIQADPQLQLRVLRELSGRIAAGASLNEVLQLVLEGIYRGIGFDRVLVALLSPNRQQLLGKLGLGAGVDALRKRFVFSLDNAPDELFNEFFRRPRTLRLEPGGKGGLGLERLKGVTSAATVCMAPIMAQGRAIGLVYAERAEPLPAVDDESVEAFQLFAQQVSVAVAVQAPGSRGG